MVSGAKSRNYVTGSMDGRSHRSNLKAVRNIHYMQLGRAWNCERSAAGDRVPRKTAPDWAE
jgi:hypothetical protein